MSTTMGLASLAGLDILPSVYDSATQCFDRVFYDKKVSGNLTEGMLRFNHVYIRLTRWGAALGIDSVDPNSDIRNLASSHPMRKAQWNRNTASIALHDLDAIKMLFDDFATKHAQEAHVGVSLADLDTTLQSNSQIRLCRAMNMIARKRRSLQWPNEGAGFVLRETKDVGALIDSIARVVDHLSSSFPHLLHAQGSLAQHEMAEFLQCGMSADDLNWFHTGGGSEDTLLRNALVRELSKQDSSDAKVVWNVHSTNFGLQTSHIAGGTFSWNAPTAPALLTDEPCGTAKDRASLRSHAAWPCLYSQVGAWLNAGLVKLFAPACRLLARRDKQRPRSPGILKDMALKPASHVSGLDIFVDMYRLNSEIDSGGINTVHRSVIADPARGIRRTQRVERWTRLKQIGRGGFGIVYLQENTAGEVRAVKVLDKQFNASQKQDFLRELMHMAYFSKDQACFPTFQGWYEDEEKMYLAMEYFPFGDLSSCLSQGGSTPLPELEVKRIIFQITEAVAMLHSKGISHRDLKPTNVFVYRKGPDWWVKLGDFGISKRVHGDDTALYTQYTGPFVAPEVSDFFSADDEDSGTYTNAVDIWSLGCLAYWLLTRETPFIEKGSLGRYCAGTIKLPVRPVVTSINASGLEFLQRCLAIQPKQRYSAPEALDSTWLQAINQEEPQEQSDLQKSTSLLPQHSNVENTSLQEVNELSVRLKKLGVASTKQVFGKPSFIGPSGDGKENHTASAFQPKSGVSTIAQHSETNSQHLGSSQETAKPPTTMATPRTTIMPRSPDDPVTVAMRAFSKTELDINSGNALLWAINGGHHCLVYGILNNLDEASLKIVLDDMCFLETLQSLASRIDEPGSINTAKLLLERGADPNTVSGTKTPLVVAVECNNLSMAKLLLEWKADVDCGPNKYSRTPLLLAAMNDQTDMAELLLAGGARTEKEDFYKCTPLMAAAEKGSLEMTRLLLAFGASLAASDSMDLTPLILSAGCGHFEVTVMLLDKLPSSGDKTSALFRAAQNGHTDTVRVLLARGADIHARAPYSLKTALHFAAAAGYVNVVRILLDRGAKTRAEDKEKYYPVNYATQNNHNAVEQLLIKADPYSLIT